MAKVSAAEEAKVREVLKAGHGKITRDDFAAMFDATPQVHPPLTSVYPHTPQYTHTHLSIPAQVYRCFLLLLRSYWWHTVLRRTILFSIFARGGFIVRLSARLSSAHPTLTASQLHPGTLPLNCIPSQLCCLLVLRVTRPHQTD